MDRFLKRTEHPVSPDSPAPKKPKVSSKQGVISASFRALFPHISPIFAALEPHYSPNLPHTFRTLSTKQFEESAAPHYLQKFAAL